MKLALPVERAGAPKGGRVYYFLISSRQLQYFKL